MISDFQDNVATPVGNNPGAAVNPRAEALVGPTVILGRVTSVDLVKNTFCVQSRIDEWPSVLINFPATETNRVIEARGHEVEVKGIGYFIPERPLPQKMDLTALRVLVRPVHGPKLSEMYGYFCS